jgi:hypothetical protein
MHRRVIMQTVPLSSAFVRYSASSDTNHLAMTRINPWCQRPFLTPVARDPPREYSSKHNNSAGWATHSLIVTSSLRRPLGSPGSSNNE